MLFIRNYALKNKTAQIMNSKIFYAELGKLLYAIADADHNVRKKEYIKLKDIVMNELVPLEKQTDQFGTDNAFYTQFEFEVATEQQLTSEEALESFISYVKQHRHDFTEEREQVCLRVMEEIASVYKHHSKAENEIFRIVKNEFKKN